MVNKSLQEAVTEKQKLLLNGTTNYLSIREISLP